MRINRGLFPAVPSCGRAPTLVFLCVVGAASFYGDSYIHLRTAEASVQTSLHVHFRTSGQAGLLFLAVGSRDFLLLELISGHLQVKLPIK